MARRSPEEQLTVVKDTHTNLGLETEDPTDAPHIEIVREAHRYAIDAGPGAATYTPPNSQRCIDLLLTTAFQYAEMHMATGRIDWAFPTSLLMSTLYYTEHPRGAHLGGADLEV